MRPVSPKSFARKNPRAFFTTKGVRKGTGLGMPIVQPNSRRPWASIKCRSSAGLGGASMRIESQPQDERMDESSHEVIYAFLSYR